MYVLYCLIKISILLNCFCVRIHVLKIIVQSIWQRGRKIRVKKEKKEWREIVGWGWGWGWGGWQTETEGGGGGGWGGERDFVLH